MAVRFSDRRDAGRQLAARLGHLADASPLVLALPRGGVPVAFEVAAALGAALDLVMVRKVGAPGREEFGIGAVVDGDDPQVVLDERARQFVHPPPGYLEAEVARQLREIERRRAAYRPGRAAPVVAGRTVVVVDDGVATGNTALASLRALRRAAAGRLVLAVPVADPEVAAMLSGEADEVVVVHTPQRLNSVGEFYADFAQTSDAEVVRLLADSAGWSG